jgi:acyl-CoA thioesterase
METVRKIIQMDKFCLETVGIELIEIEPGRAKAKLEITEGHLNGLGTVQGGAIFTLADLALAAAANSHGTAAVLINGNISYFKAISQGILYAEAKEESLNNKLATYTIRINDDEDSLIAMMQATVYRKKDRLESVLK